MTRRARLLDSRAMYYAIIARDHAHSLDKRRAERPAHLARLDALRAQGRLLVAGPMPAIDATDPGPAGFVGSLVVAEFESLAAARAFAESDVYVSAGVWAEVRVEPFLRVY